MDKIIIEEFLMVSLFGANYQANPVKAAINRAYRDFCRTIRNKKGEMNEGIILDVGKDKNAKTKTTKDIATDEIKGAINSIKNDYDLWQKSLCEKLKGMGYTFGQAQKWVNMTMKYLIVLNYKPIKPYIEEFHAPIDNDIIKTAFRNGFKAEGWEKADSVSWSSKDFDKTKYNLIKQWIDGQAKKEKISPIEWEFRAWNDPSAKDK